MKYCFIIAAIFLSIQLQAQKQGQALVDSLLQELPKSKFDTATVKLYNRISDLYIDIDQAKALQYADSGLSKAKSVGWKRGVGGAMLAKGNVYNFNGNPAKAIDLLKEAAAIFREIDYKFGEAASINALAKSYEVLSDYPNAINYFIQALKIHESIPNNDLRIAMSLSGIATVYYRQKDYKKSLDYSFKALQKKEASNNKTGIANENKNIADTYYEMGDSINAEKYNRKALELYKVLNNKMGMCDVYSQLGKLYKNDYSKALGYFLQSKKISSELNDDSPFFSYRDGEVAQVLLEMIKHGDITSANKLDTGLPANRNGLLNVADKYLEKAIEVSKEEGDKENEYLFANSLAEVKAQKGDYKNAYESFRTFHFLQDSIYSQENKNAIAGIEGQREVAIRDKEIEINKLALFSQRKTQLALIGGLLLVSIIGGLLYWQSRTRKKTNTTLLKLNTELDEANKVKARFFGILSHDLRGPISNLVNFLHLQKEAPGLLTAEQTANNGQKISSAAEGLLETMESMLIWSKGQMQQFKPQFKLVEVSSLFNHLQQFFSSTENVAMRFNAAPGLKVSTDENYLQTIMHNLTSNAVKALKNTSNATIEWNAKQQGNKIILSITDNGPGIKPEQINALYDDSSALNTKTGFGLHIIRDLAKAIQCKISMQPAAGQGTTFILTA